jgi:hypothetical protein|tara:strand:- start:1163 stop:1582 length:420 start_codon:yes stop_codon:yes gene_type:complete
MTYRIFNFARRWLMLGLLVFAVIDLALMRDAGLVISSYHGLENWEERRVSSWLWYDHFLEWFGFIFALAIGWLVGRLWTVRKYSDLPKWAKRFFHDDPELTDEEKEREIEMPTRKDLIFIGIGIVGLMVWSIVDKAVGQ